MIKAIRNWHAVNAFQRSSAGPMKHKNEPRKGATNSTNQIMDQAQDEWGDMLHQDNIDQATGSNDEGRNENSRVKT